MRIFIEKDNRIHLNGIVKNILILMSVILSIVLTPFFLIFILIGWLGIKSYIKHVNMMRAFAEENNLEFVSDKADQRNLQSNLKARLFETGHSKNISNLMRGEYKGHPIQIFNYQYTVGSGKNSHTYTFTICEVGTEKTNFPHIFLKSNKMWNYSRRVAFGGTKDTKINLEKDYSKVFNLYCTQNYEIETLQIFTHDLLDYLSENAPRFSIEFSGRNIYFYNNKTIRRREDLDTLYVVAKNVVDRTDGLLNRLHNDFDSLHEAYRNKSFKLN